MGKLVAYVGQTRAAKLIERLRRHGLGEITQPREWPPRRRPAVLDNGAFSAWRAGRTFRASEFSAVLERASASPPKWVVLPDIVMGGQDSALLSLRWIGPVAKALPGVPRYFAVQPGIAEDKIPWSDIGGLFVGGSTEWKYFTAARWIKLAHERGLKCHIGRCGTARKVEWARSINADSIDSCVPLFAERNLDRFVAALSDGQRLLPFFSDELGRPATLSSSAAAAAGDVDVVEALGEQRGRRGFSSGARRVPGGVI